MNISTEEGILLLKRKKQYVDMKGNVYNMDDNGNIDDMVQGAITNLQTAPDSWFTDLTADEYRAVDIIYGGLTDGTS